MAIVTGLAAVEPDQQQLEREAQRRRWQGGASLTICR
jgi:hypothetical protein